MDKDMAKAPMPPMKGDISRLKGTGIVLIATDKETGE